MIGQGWRLWLRIAVPGGVVALLLTGLPVIVVAAIDRHHTGYSGLVVWMRTGRLPTPPPMPATQVWTWISLVFSAWMYLAILRLTLGATVASPTITWLEALKLGIRRIGAGLWTGFAAFVIFLGLAIVLMVVGFLVLRVIVVLGLTIIAFGALLIFTALSLCFVAVIVDGDSGFKATGRSWEVIRGSLWTALGACTLMFLLTGLFSFAITIFPQVVFSQDGAGAVGRAVAAALASCVTIPLTGAILSVIYLELRARLEPVDPAILRAAVEAFGT
jgi:hypothetical protein